MKYRTVIGAIAVIVLAASVGLAQDKEDASSHFKKGVSLFNSGKKDEAVQEFYTAYEIKPSWKILYNIGQCHASLKQYGLAIESFEKYLGEGGDDVPKDRQDEVLSELDRLRKMVGRVMVHGPDGVEIYIDKILRGKTPVVAGILTTAGLEHQIWLIKDGKKLLAINETVSGAGVLELTVPSEDDGAAAGAVTGATGAAVGGTAAGGDEVAGTTGAEDTGTGASGADTGDQAGGDAGNSGGDDGGTATPKRSGLSPVIFIATASTAVVFGAAAGGLAAAVNAKWEKSLEKIYDDPWSTDTEAVSANIHTMQILGYVSLGVAAVGLVTAVTVIPFTDWQKNKSKKVGSVHFLPWAGKNVSGLSIEGRF